MKLAPLSIAALGAALLLAAPAYSAPSGGGGASLGGNSESSARRDDPARAYQAGVAALQARDYAEAVRQLRIARRAAPNDPTMNYVLGLAYVGAGDASEARPMLERAVRGADTRPDAHAQLGLVYLELGRRNEAEAQLAELAEDLAGCDAACGDGRRAQLQTAHDQLARALNPPAEDSSAADPATTSWTFPSAEEGRAAYAEAVGLINQERFADALLALERAQTAAGPNADVLNYMGFASRKLGRFDAALAYYSAALRLEPAHLGATEYLGELYLEMGDAAAARRQLARLDDLCAYGCAEREELARWIDASGL